MSFVKDISEIPSPCFVLYESELIRNLSIIREVKEKADVEIILAFKGFAMWSTFPTLLSYINGATASSLNEVRLCNEKMGKKAHTYCVAFDPKSFDSIVSQSSHITFNSLGQYYLYIDQVPKEVTVGLRVNPEWSDVTTDLYNPSNPTSRLGITSARLDHLPDRVEGLHFHVLCESTSHALEKVLEQFETRFGHLLPNIKWVNMGGGHLITEEDYDRMLLINLLRDFKERHDVDIILEPGSAFAWNAGDLVTTVLDIVENGGAKTAVIDASFTCHMPDCLEMPYRPEIKGASKTKINGSHSYRIGGVSCLAGDYLDEYWFKKNLRIGDQLIFKDMMHYTMVKTNMFNGIHHPSIGVVKENGKFELIREFEYLDYESRLS